MLVLCMRGCWLACNSCYVFRVVASFVASGDYFGAVLVLVEERIELKSPLSFLDCKYDASYAVVL